MTSSRPDFPESLLSRLRWRQRQGHQWPGGGTSRRPAEGEDFEGHRRWQSGEDLQHLDLHVWQRLRQRWIREYRQEADEPVHVLIDTASSMTFGERATALQHLRTLLKGVAKKSRVPHREWIIRGDSIEPCTASALVDPPTRVPLNDVLSRLPENFSRGRVIVISDRLTFDELSEWTGSLPVRSLQWWSLWLEEESNPSWQGDLRLTEPGGDSWQSHFDAPLIQQYRQLLQNQILILQDWLQSRGGRHVSVSADSSAAKILEELTGSRGPLEVISG